jgi:hypothetical protein
MASMYFISMEKFIPHIYSFILPLFVGNLIHMFIVKGDYFHHIARPISTTLFGSGKTYRAFVVMPPICGLSSLVLRSLILHDPGYLWAFSGGLILGVAYLVGELPNSFVKRRLGIQSGQHHSRYKFVQYVIDKSDSLIVSCVVYFFISDITAVATLALFAVSFVIHIFFSWLLVKVRIKKSF